MVLVVSNYVLVKLNKERLARGLEGVAPQMRALAALAREDLSSIPLLASRRSDVPSAKN